MDVPDTPRHVRDFGRPGSHRARPLFRRSGCCRKCQAGTHVQWRSLVKPQRRSEVVMAHHLLGLWDRNFLSDASVQEVVQEV